MCHSSGGGPLQGRRWGKEKGEPTGEAEDGGPFRVESGRLSGRLRAGHPESSFGGVDHGTEENGRSGASRPEGQPGGHEVST